MDFLIRVTVGGFARAFIANTRETVNKAASIHETSPAVTAAFGRMLTAAALMSADLKNDGNLLTIRTQSNGALKSILVTADNLGNVKGCPYTNSVDLPLREDGKLDVAGAVGAGYLTVIKDLGLKEPYSGTVELVSGEIAEDIAYYFTASEQVPSAVALGVLVDTDYSVKNAGGFIIQMLPDAVDTDEFANSLEERIYALGGVTAFFERGKTPRDLAEYLFHGYDYTVSDESPINYLCNCSRERMETALASLGRAEISNIVEEDGKATLHCHFCGKDYEFTKEELLAVR
ncbi:33 kDa chaperonin [Clostridia bacterium]|nr:33 kDa chaperonin [Clostridia bacterium]